MNKTTTKYNYNLYFKIGLTGSNIDFYNNKLRYDLGRKIIHTLQINNAPQNIIDDIKTILKNQDLEALLEYPINDHIDDYKIILLPIYDNVCVKSTDDDLDCSKQIAKLEERYLQQKNKK